MICPKCGCDELYRDSVDVGVGMIYGPYGCPDCFWSEDPKYDFSDGKSNIDENGNLLDQYGGLWPADSDVAKFAKIRNNNE